MLRLAEPKETDQLLWRRTLRLMGNTFEISVLSDNEEWAYSCIDASVEEIQRIENLLSTFKESSQTNLINTHAGIEPVIVDIEVVELIERAIKISKLTQGAFDISYGSIDKRLWNFDLNMKSLPSPEEAKKSVRLINYKNIEVDKNNSKVFLKEKGMRIGFGAIGKGYAAERAKFILQSLGIKTGIVNAAGDLVVWGKQSSGEAFTVGIADPASKHKPFSSLNITDMAIATSGNYEKYVTIDGKNYSHTIDPKTGFPVHGIKSVTIICPNGEIADAMATPVMVMGVKAGLHLVNQIKGMACIIIDEQDKIFTTDNIRII